MGTLLQDLRFGARTLAKAPGLSVVAVIALALGIGANTAMFSIVNTVLLRPLPYAEPDRLVQLYTSMPQFREASVSYPNFLDWQQRSRSFDSMAAYRGDTFNLTGEVTPERLRGEMASADIFVTLGVKPILGRTFTADEDRKGGAPVVVLTSNFWKTRFGGDPRVLGRSLTLSERLYTVIGVVPSDDVLWRRTSIIVPIGQWTEPLFWNRGVGMGMRVVGRLKGGRSLPQAQAELDSIAAGLAREYPTENKDRGIRAVSLRENLTGDVRTPGSRRVRAAHGVRQCRQSPVGARHVAAPGACDPDGARCDAREGGAPAADRKPAARRRGSRARARRGAIVQCVARGQDRRPAPARRSGPFGRIGAGLHRRHRARGELAVRTRAGTAYSASRCDRRSEGRRSRQHRPPSSSFDCLVRSPGSR